MGALSHGHSAQSPSHRKKANKSLLAVYLDSAANDQIFTHFIIRVQQEHLMGKLCNTKGAVTRGVQAASGRLGYDHLPLVWDLSC